MFIETLPSTSMVKVLLVEVYSNAVCVTIVGNGSGFPLL